MSNNDEGAREALVEQLAEAIGGALDTEEPSWGINDRAHEALTRAATVAVLPVVAAQVEAAVSVVRAEAAGKVDRASQSARRADLRAQAVETERDEARAEAERLKRGGAELGKIVVRHGEMVLDATGLHDWIDEDGDGDWAAVWENLATLRPRAESAESDLRALQEGLEALADEFDLPRERGGGDFGPFYAEKVRALLASSPAEGSGQ